MTEWLTAKLGAKAGLIIVCVALVALAAMILAIDRCTSRRAVADQAEQTTRSGEAIGAAASDAVEVVTNRSIAERDIEAATAQAREVIGNAVSASEVRTAVTSALCKRKEYANDPACIR